MKHTLKTFLAMAVTLTLALAFAPFHASAVSGGSATFDCFLIVDETATVPAMTFNYTITQGAAVAATDETLAVTPGPVVTADDTVTAPTIGTAAFAVNAETTDEETTGIQLDEGQKYVKNTVTVDFSGVTFNEVGIYRYIITETVTVNGATYQTDEVTVKNTDSDAILYTVKQDTQAGDDATLRQRYMDVYVTNDTNGGFALAYILHKTAAVGSDTDKSTGIVNSVSSHSLTFGKKVTGNQGNKNQYFKFTLTLNNLDANAKYAVIPPAEENYAENPNKIESDGDKAASAVFYLKHGQYITIQGLPDGFTYTLAEDAESAAGYTRTEKITEDDNGAAYTDPVSSDSGVTKSVKTGFTNERNGVIPTGLLLTVTPFVVGLFLFGALFVYIMARRRREY